MIVDIEKLKALRKKTGISIAMCKKALEEAKNNPVAAEKLLTKWGTEKISDKENRVTTAGAIFSYLHHDKKVASLIEILCETDFVSQNTEFQKLGAELAMQVASMQPKTVDQLLKQEYIRDPSKKVNNLIKEAILKFGENIKIKKFIRWAL